jgi:hypothetical protein
LKFERRQMDRWQVGGVATAFELAGDSFGRMHTLRMVDYSDEGFGATSPSMLTPGTSVSIGFQEPGYMAKRGTIIRCEPVGEGYRIGVVFERRMAA